MKSKIILIPLLFILTTCEINPRIEKILNAVIDPKSCTTVPFGDGLCMKVGADGEYARCSKETGNNHCSMEEANAQCTEIKKFITENCTNDDQCYTNNCVNQQCTYKGNGSPCTKDKECEQASYCRFEGGMGTCTPFLTENGDCSATGDKCSPQFFCSSESKCAPRGVKKDDEDASNPEECQSFKLNKEGTKCSSNYNLTLPEDFLAKKKSAIFKNIMWNSVKLSDLTGKNFGDEDLLNKMLYDIEAEYLAKSGSTEQIWECARPLIKDLMIFDTQQHLEYTLIDSGIKKFLGINKDTLTCKAKTGTSSVCYELTRDEDYNAIESYMGCGTDERCFKTADEKGECKKTPKLLGQKCGEDSECLTLKCNLGTCSYKEDGQSCASDYECGMNSYCGEGQCKQYGRFIGDPCDTSKRCSPQYVCVDGQCQKIGTLAVGELVADEKLCASFKMDEDYKCTDNYDLSKDDDFRKHEIASVYRSIDFTNTKLSNYDSDNFGNLQILKDLLKRKTLRAIDEKYDQTTYTCAEPIVREFSVLGVSQKYALNDYDLAQFVNISYEKPPEYKCDYSFDNDFCFETTYDEHVKPVKNDFHYCNKEKGHFCFAKSNVSSSRFECDEVKKFDGERCNGNEDCYSGSCRDETCATIRDDEQGSCQTDDQCGQKSFCGKNNTCVKYILEENAPCDGVNTKCSPQFVCAESHCLKKGEKEDGESVTDGFQCKSFKKDKDNLCTREYTNSSSTDYLAKLYAEEFPLINWNQVKLSIYDHPNMGSLKIFEEITQIKKDELTQLIGIANAECVMNSYEEYLAMATTNQREYDLTPLDKKNHFNLPESEITCKNVNPKKGLLSDAYKTFCYTSVEVGERRKWETLNLVKCDKKKLEYCYDNDENSDPLKVSTCSKLKKFLNADCAKDEECFTGECKMTKCVYKEDNQNCTTNAECGLNSYCQYYFDETTGDEKQVCTPYVTHLNDPCSDTKACSPQYICLKNTCKAKGNIKNGDSADVEEQCQSFKRDPITGKCTGTYDSDSFEDQIRQMKSQKFKNLNWVGAKKSVYAATNMGDEKILELYLKHWFASYEKKNETDLSECILPTLREVALLGQHDKYALPEDLIKKVLNIEQHQKEADKSSDVWKYILIVLAVLVVGAVAVIGFLYFYKVGRKDVTAETIEKEIGDNFVPAAE